MFIGVDIGGSSIRVGGFSGVDNPQLLKYSKGQINLNYEEELGRLIELIVEESDGKAVEGIGMGIAGVWDEGLGKLVKSPNLQHWIGENFKEALSRYFNCKVVVANDAVAAALGEARYGHGKGRSFLYITWGSGIGGVVIRTLGTKREIQSFEPGHQIIQLNGPDCTCGQKGCWEQFVGGNGIEKRYGRSAESLDEKQWHEVMEYLSQGLINCLVMHPVDLMIFGGGVALNQTQRLDKMNGILKERMKIYPVPEIKLAALGENVGVYGAVSLIEGS